VRVIQLLSHLSGIVALPFATAAALAQADTEKPYLQEVKAAMDTMMAGMMGPSTGDVDRDFVTMMRPHHQGAIDMAVAELKHGRNEQLKRIAQEIIVDQQQEIAAMNLAIGDPLPPSAPAPTQGTPAPDEGMAGMSMPAATHDHTNHQEH
jgi:hypothetical protein